MQEFIDNLRSKMLARVELPPFEFPESTEGSRFRMISLIKLLDICKQSAVQ
jgi:hypothetical protein